MKDNLYFSFVLANTDNGYILSTFKIGTIMIQSNATDFLQFCVFDSSKNKIIPVNEIAKRPPKGNPNDVAQILKNEHITCLVRNPSDRLFSGLFQELLTNNYGLKDLFISFSHSESFREKVCEYLIHSIPAYWERLILTAHCDSYHYFLHTFLDHGYVDNFTIKHIDDLKFEIDEPVYRHSNKKFLFPMYDAIKYLTKNSSEFSKKFTKFIDKEWKYYQYLIDDQKKKDTENG